jgi:hypothetical protein
VFRASTRLLGVAIAVIALLASGCNGGKGTQSPPGSPASSSTASPRAAPSAGETVPTEPTLRSALLTAQDAGPAFRVANADNPGPQLPGGVGGQIPAADISLTSGGGNTGSAEALTETLFAASGFLIDQVHTALRDDLPKGQLTNDLQPQGAADLGPGVTAVRLHKQEQGISMDGYDAIARVSPTVALLLIFRQAGSTSAAQEARDLFQKALRKASTTLQAYR